MNETKIRASAKHEECAIRLPGICNRNPETTVFAHISGIRFGHGAGKKTKWGAYACSSCHDLIDSRTKSHLSKEYIKLAHYEGVLETLLLLQEEGLVKLV
jgi:hypothetical protein